MPPLQPSLDPQPLPQPPQFCGSVFVSTHIAPHIIEPPTHDSPHCPAEQTWPVSHTCPHVPQFPGSSRVSTHVPPHAAVPDPHDVCPLPLTEPHAATIAAKTKSTARISKHSIPIAAAAAQR
jgi:hypothetical protein